MITDIGEELYLLIFFFKLNFLQKNVSSSLWAAIKKLGPRPGVKEIRNRFFLFILIGTVILIRYQ